MKSEQNSSRHYGIAPGTARVQYGLAALIGCLPVLFLICGIFDSSCFAIALILGLIQSPFVAFLIWNARRMAIRLTAEGVEFRNVIGRKTDLSWAAIEYFDSTPGHEGFVLHQSLSTPAALRLADTAGVRFRGASIYTANEEAHLAVCRWVPMRCFAGWLRRGEMLADWDRFAPHLAERYRAEQGQRTRLKEQSRDTLTMVVVITLMILIPTIAISASGVPLPADVAAKLMPLLNVGHGILMGLLGLTLGATAMVNFLASFRKLTQWRIGSGLLWGAAALMQVLLAMLAISQGLGGNG